MFNFSSKNKEVVEVKPQSYDVPAPTASSTPTVTSNEPVEYFSPETFGDSEVNDMQLAVAMVNNVAVSVTQMTKIIANVTLEIKRLDHDLDMFIAASNVKLERFRAAMPVLSKQLDNVSKRIDTITETMLKNIMDANDENTLKKHQAMLGLLNTANDSFNNMLTKLISL